MAREVVDLRNPNNEQKNNHQETSDVLELKDAELEDEPVYEQPESFSGEEKYLQEYEDIDPADKLFEKAQPDKIDRELEKLDNPAMNNELSLPTLISWAAPEVHHELISHAWRKAVIVILVAMAFITLFWQKSVLTAFTFIILAIVTSMHFWRRPGHQEYSVHPHGVVVGGQFYDFHELESFWINYDPRGVKELSLRKNGGLNPYVKVPLGESDPNEIRATLMNYLIEEPHEEGLDDWLRRKLGL